MHPRRILAALALVASATLCVAADDRVVFGYYNLAFNDQASDIDFSQYTHVNLGFGLPQEDGTITYNHADLIAGVAENIQRQGAQVLISVGSWEGSQWFSAIMANEDNRTSFIANIVDFVSAHKLDGVDILWEYPGKATCSCFGADSTNDVPNFLQFLEDLREGLDHVSGAGNKLLTIGVSYDLYAYDGDKKMDYKKFADVVDYAHILAFGINGAWQGDTGPYAPFYTDSRGAPYSFVSAIDTWIGAGWPPAQLTAGISFGGRGTNTLADMTGKLTNQYQPQGNPYPCESDAQCPGNIPNVTNPCTGAQSINDKWDYKALRAGALTSATASTDYARQWDNGSMTPWLFNSTVGLFFTYDDPDSIVIKVNYAAQKGLAGAAVWMVHMDYNDELLDVVRNWQEGSTPIESTPASTAPAATSITSANNNDAVQDEVATKTLSKSPGGGWQNTNELDNNYWAGGVVSQEATKTLNYAPEVATKTFDYNAEVATKTWKKDSSGWQNANELDKNYWNNK